MKTTSNPSGARPAFEDAATDTPTDEAEGSWSSQFDEMSQYASHYFAARSDLWRTRSSKLIWNLATGAGAGVVGICLAAAAASKLLAGIAGGLTVLLGGRGWAGDLLAGGLVIVSAGLGFFILRMRVERERRRRLFEKYARRHDLQTERFGHDMSDRAAG